MIDKLGKGIEAVTKVVDSATDKVSKAKDKALEYVPSIDIGVIEEKLECIGYSVPRVEIAITIPPRIAIEIDLDKSNVNEELKEKVKEEGFNLEDQDITQRALVKVIQGLDSAVKLKEKISFKNKKLARVQVEGSMVPTVKLRYLSKKP